MKKSFSKAAFLMGIALAFSVASYAQESKTKIEGDGYELKIKQEKDEFKVKQKGQLPASHSMVQHNGITVKQGQTVTTVKTADMPVAQAPAAKKKTYASRKKCSCATVAKRKPAAKKHHVAYKAKPAVNHTASTARLRDTVYITRVDTVFSINEVGAYTGYRPGSRLRDDFKKLKIEKDGDEIKMKKEYEGGKTIKRTFESEEDYNTYMEWKNY